MIAACIVACGPPPAPNPPAPSAAPTATPTAPAPKVDHAEAARELLAAVWSACPGDASDLGIISIEKCEAADAVVAFPHWHAAEVEAVLFEAIASETEHERMWGANLLDKKGPHQTVAASAGRLMDAMESEKVSNVALVLGQRMGAVDLDGTGLAIRAEALLRSASVHSRARRGMMYTLLTSKNRERFRPIIVELKKDSNSDIAKYAALILDE